MLIGRDIAGQKFSRLTAIKKIKPGTWMFRCDCGSEIEKQKVAVTRGNTKSCGCLRKDRVTERNRDGAGTRRKDTRVVSHPLYNLWNGMKARCSNPNHVGYRNYGARGVKVCERWSDFWAFVEDMGERPVGTTLDRVDPSGDYTPDNCRWATRKQQSLNTSRNIRLTHNDVTLTVREWADRLGVDQKLLNRRRALGWPVDRILSVGDET
jgi:hypothetical protein